MKKDYRVSMKYFVQEGVSGQHALVDIIVAVKAKSVEEAVAKAKESVSSAKIRYKYTSCVETDGKVIQIGVYGKTEEDRAEGILGCLTPGEKDAIYRSVWFDHVVADVKSMDNGLTGEQAEYVASRYVYDGEYDCERSYWENLNTLIRAVKKVEE